MGCENCKHLIIQNGYAPKCIKGEIPFYTGNCPLFEKDPNIDNYRVAKPKVKKITNRQWLNSLSNEEFAEWCLQNQIIDKNDFMKWLEKEHLK